MAVKGKAKASLTLGIYLNVKLWVVGIRLLGRIQFGGILRGGRINMRGILEYIMHVAVAGNMYVCIYHV